MRPSHLPELPSNSHPYDFVKGINDEGVPQFYVYMDGKPSDRYIKDGNYCLAMLISNKMNTLFSLGDRINEALKPKGLKFKKISRIRKKRRQKYASAVLDILIDISTKERGLRYNWKIAIGSAEAMNPKAILQYFKDNNFVRELFNAEIDDNYVIFEHDNNKIKVRHNDFGGMVWWHSNLLHIASDYKAEERNASWWLHMDRLPLDHNLKKTKLFASILDMSFKNKLWMSCTGNDELAIDIFPDFYAYIYYEATFNREHMDPLLLKKIQTLHMLNTKEYWSNRG